MDRGTQQVGRSRGAGRPRVLPRGSSPTVATVSAVVTAVGASLVLVVMWDVFHTLWHPSGQGRLSKGLMAGVWRACRPLGERARDISGAAAVTAVILAWGVLMVVGWALVYWPRMPDAFTLSTTPAPTAFVDAFYFSVVSLATVGYGDIAPATPWLRLVAPAEATLGFALLTAAVSWVLQVYPALTRRRVLALKLGQLDRSGVVDAFGALETPTAVLLLSDLTDRLAQVHVDLVQYSESYYFRDTQESSSLAATLPHALALARRAQGSRHEDVRRLGGSLAGALDEFATLLDRQYLHTDADVDGVLAAYRDDHGRT